MKARPMLILLACAGSAASAQTTRITFEASADPPTATSWTNDLTVAPGATVYVRMRVRLEGATAYGLAGITTQPTLTNWTSADSVLPFTFPGLDMYGAPTIETAYEGRHVPAEPQSNTGRIFPWATSTQNAASASGLRTSFVDGGNTLRFAGSKNTMATINTAWGVASSQFTAQLGGTNFVADLDVVVFRYGVRVGDAGAARDLSATMPVSYVNLGRASWYQNANMGGVNAPVTAIDPATIHVLPSQAPLAAGVLSIATASGRRRRT